MNVGKYDVTQPHWQWCLAVGKINKFLLKTPTQQQAARSAIEHYRQLQEHLEELSQINAELLRREEPLRND